MSSKSPKIASMIEAFRGNDLDPHYLAFFDCFNRGLFFEAHEVLEDLWLPDRGPDRAFYQGLIQLAGAFVHFQKGRLKPAGALLRLTTANLQKYPARHYRLQVDELLARIHSWLRELESNSYANTPFAHAPYPRLELVMR